MLLSAGGMMGLLVDKYRIAPGVGVVVFDPVTLTGLTLAATAASGAMTAAGTLAAGSTAKQAGQMAQTGANFQAQQLSENATQSIASGQRQMLDTQQRTRLAISTATANASASGANAGVGSPAADIGALSQRGSYQALMDMFNGQSKATGLENEAAGETYTGDIEELEGEEKQSASYLSAAGTIAGTAGSMFSSYGKATYPTARGSAGVG